MSTLSEMELDQITQNLSPSQKAMFETQYASAKKNRGTALALSIVPFVGHLGFGRFYLGQTGLGFLHIGLMIAFLFPGVVFWIVDWFLIGKACDEYNRAKAREIAIQVRALGAEPVRV